MGPESGADAGQGGITESGATPAAAEFKPITSQEDLNRLIADRVSRERAKYSDYKDLRAKAAKLDEIEQANQTELEKATKRATEIEAERDQARAEALRLRIATKHGISDEDADLFLTGTDEATLTKQAERLAARVDGRKKQSNHVPREGTNPKTAAASDERQFVRELFGPGG